MNDFDRVESISGPRNDSHISSGLISPESVQQKLASILPDMFVVDLNFKILIPSKSILHVLEYATDEVHGQSINFIAGKTDLVSLLLEALAGGYFEDYPAILYSKGGRKIDVNISGFYLGLISDINGRIVLKVRNLGEVDSVLRQLQEKKQELDNFIYRVSHDIRGPLATIQGLVNLIKIREDNSEIDRLMQMIDAHAIKLDERLFQLVYLAQADDEDRVPVNIVDFSFIETSLRKVIEQNAFIDFLELHFAAPEAPLAGINEVSLNSLLTNILLYLLSLPKAGLNHQLFFRFEIQEMYLRITIGADGFRIQESSQKAIGHMGSIYTDTLNYPKLLNFFAAQKLAWKLNSALHVHFLTDEKQRINLIVPVEQPDSLSAQE